MFGVRVLCGRVAELVYAYASEAYPARVGGSSPLTPTQNENRSLLRLEAFCIVVQAIVRSQFLAGFYIAFRNERFSRVFRNHIWFSRVV